MMILWVLILLDIIVLQFAVSMRTEVEITRNFRDRIEAYYLARAATELARFELMYVASVTKNPPVADSKGMIDFRAGKEERDSNPQWMREVALGRGAFSIMYHVKEDKYDLNHLASRGGEKDLEDVLVACGFEPETAELSIIKQSIIDWADKNHENSHPDSAEDDWYKDNWQGYECKDDRFYSVEELALIKGLRPERGDSEDETEEKKRILSDLYERVVAHPFLNHRKINRNVATWKALEAKYDEFTIEDYFSQRDEGNPIDKTRPTHYEVITTGWVKGSLAERQIKAEFLIRGSQKIQLISWTDNYIPLKEWDPNQELERDEPI
ncbi:MAG: general secretion pathway protein GspK [Thermoplasmata archaeon]|nr:MAG: general secretion pathway protein GspK [Thermoplasmata archaeon]